MPVVFCATGGEGSSPAHPPEAAQPSGHPHSASVSSSRSSRSSSTEKSLFRELSDAFPAVMGPKFWPRLRWALWLVVLIALCRSSVGDVCDVPSRSMMPTLLVGDRVLVNKLAYGLRAPLLPWRVLAWRQPQRGDVVVFLSPKDGLPLVKRVIGLPGDEVELKDGVVWLNGTASRYDAQPGNVRSEALPGIPAHRLAANAPWHEAMANSTSAVRVPDGTLFVLGDNRDESFDSRYLGFIDQARLVGRAERIVFSISERSRLRRGRALTSVH